MKNYLFAICLCITIFSFGQTFKKEKLTVEFSVPVKVVNASASTGSYELKQGSYTFEAESLENKKATGYLHTGILFKVVGLDDQFAVLQAIPFTQKPSKNKTKRIKKEQPDYVWYGEIYNDVLFTIKREDFDAHAVEPSRAKDDKGFLSVGFLTLPFKARPESGGNVSFDTEFNLNSTLNIRFWKSITDVSINAQVGAGIGSVGLKRIPVAGIDADVDTSQDVATLTLVGGFMAEYHRVQVGLYAGVDYINNQDVYQWDKNGNIWFGFGVGFKLFALKFADKVNSIQQNQ